MTKAKAIEQMLKNDRAIIAPEFARKIAKAFGYTLTDLKLKPKKCEDFYRATYVDGGLTAIAVYQLAIAIAQEFEPNWKAEMPYHGWGSNCEHMTKTAIEVIKKNLA
jgi:hypothetical protein